MHTRGGNVSSRTRCTTDRLAGRWTAMDHPDVSITQMDAAGDSADGTQGPLSEKPKLYTSRRISTMRVS